MLRRRVACCDGGLDEEVELVLLHGLHSSTLGRLLSVVKPGNYLDVGDGRQVLATFSMTKATTTRLIITVTAPVKTAFTITLRSYPWSPSVDRGNSQPRSLAIADARQSVFGRGTRNCDVHVMRHISGFTRSRKQCVVPTRARYTTSTLGARMDSVLVPIRATQGSLAAPDRHSLSDWRLSWPFLVLWQGPCSFQRCLLCSGLVVQITPLQDRVATRNDCKASFSGSIL